MSDPRQNHKDAHAYLIAVQERVDECASIYERGARFVAATEQEAAGFEDVPGATNAERAESVRQAMAAGLAPSMTLSPALQERVAGKVEADNKAEAARLTLGALKSDLEAARADEATAKGLIAACARTVLQAEAEQIAVRLRALEVDAAAYRVRLCGLENVWAAIGDGRSGPIPLSPFASAVMNDIGTVARMQSFNSTEYRARAAAATRWSAYA
jgi:hypothetical protein